MNIKKICKQCGRKLEDKKHPNRIFCSRKCCGLYQRKRKKLTCFICDKSFYRTNIYYFTRKDKSIICCSWKCLKKRYDKIVIKRVCKNCGKTYRPQSNFKNQTFCSRLCRDKFRSKNNIKKICKKCGKSFKVTPSAEKYHHPKYCSKECKYADYEKEKHWHWKGITANRICPSCGKEFKPKSVGVKGFKGATKYCSIKCARKKQGIKMFISPFLEKLPLTEIDKKAIKSMILIHKIRRSLNVNK